MFWDEGKYTTAFIHSKVLNIVGWHIIYNKDLCSSLIGFFLSSFRMEENKGQGNQS